MIKMLRSGMILPLVIFATLVAGQEIEKSPLNEIGGSSLDSLEINRRDDEELKNENVLLGLKNREVKAEDELQSKNDFDIDLRNLDKSEQMDLDSSLDLDERNLDESELMDRALSLDVDDENLDEVERMDRSNSLNIDDENVDEVELKDRDLSLDLDDENLDRAEMVDRSVSLDVDIDESERDIGKSELKDDLSLPLDKFSDIQERNHNEERKETDETSTLEKILDGSLNRVKRDLDDKVSEGYSDTDLNIDERELNEADLEEEKSSNTNLDIAERAANATARSLEGQSRHTRWWFWHHRRWRCRRGWRHYRGSCYGFFGSYRNYFSAKHQCRRYGGHLVYITSSAEYYYLRRFIRGSYWIGLTDRRWEGHYRWDNGVYLRYRYWLPHQPNNYRNQDCVEFMRTRCGRIGWNDLNCYYRRKFICEAAPRYHK